MQSYYLKKAAENEPIIYRSEIQPMRYGFPISDENEWFQYRFVQAIMPESLKAGESFCIDFGSHYTGYLSFAMNRVSNYPDAPVRVRVKLAENLYELGRDFDTYKGGISASWLQEEVFNIDEPGVVRMPRRYAFRYVKISIEAMGNGYPVNFSDFLLTAVTSADTSKYRAVTTDPELQKIDEVGCRTLANCMQRVFEDGPKRDRRLWIGDLRLQALTAYDTFQSVDVAKRCMYLFAAHTKPGQRVPRDIFQNSTETYSDGNWLADYALMFPICLCDYYEYTGDDTLVNDLFYIADEQIQIAYADTEDGVVRELDGWWAHIDWCDGLQKVTSMQGVLLYAIKKMTQLCRSIGKTDKAKEYAEYAEILKVAAKNKLYDVRTGYFVNAYDREQLSVHSQVWMILGEVVEGEQAKQLLERVIADKQAKQPGSPYMHHYVVEAMLVAGMEEEVLVYIKKYWGEMIRCGADTFWEIFVPGEFSTTPYADPVINSSCHAWSCTASYFIRKIVRRS